MKTEHSIQVFGVLSIPRLSEGELTANYFALPWKEFRETFHVSMYRTIPGTDVSIEKTSINLSGKVPELAT